MSYTAWSVTQDEVPDATKWNYLGANDAYFYSFLGDNIEWQSWTPTWTGITKGGATVAAYYTQVGKTVFCRVRFAFGSGTVMTGTPVFTLPVTAHSRYTTAVTIAGSAYIEDYLTGTWCGYPRLASTTTASIHLMTTSGTYSTTGIISTTAPFTWASGDYFAATIIYEAA